MYQTELSISPYDLHQHARLQKRAGRDVGVIHTVRDVDHDVLRAAHRIRNDGLITWINSDRYAVRPIRVPYETSTHSIESALVIPDIENVAIEAGFVDDEQRPDYVGMLIDPEFTAFRTNARLLEAVVWERVAHKDGNLPVELKFTGEKMKLAREMRQRIDSMPCTSSTDTVKLIWSFAKGCSALVGMSSGEASETIRDVSTNEALKIFLREDKYADEDGSALGYNLPVARMVVDSVMENRGIPDADVLSWAVDEFDASRIRVW